MQTLYERRDLLCYKFAKKGLRLSQFKSLFPVNKSLHVMKRRSQGKYFVNKAKTERYKQSSIRILPLRLSRWEILNNNNNNNNLMLITFPVDIFGIAGRKVSYFPAGY